MSTAQQFDGREPKKLLHLASEQERAAMYAICQDRMQSGLKIIIGTTAPLQPGQPVLLPLKPSGQMIVVKERSTRAAFLESMDSSDPRPIESAPFYYELQFEAKP